MRPHALILTAILGFGLPGIGSAQQGQQPTFRTSVDRVMVAATVRDQRGRPVTTLKAEDFQLFDSGQAQKILDFQREPAPISLAVLADYSGSMDVAQKRATARDMVRQLIGWLTPAQDRVGLYAFDHGLEEVLPLQLLPSDLLARMDALEPWGKTRLFDAIAETGRRLAATGASRRAVVVLTDGDDNASSLTATQVSAIASGIDVPVYVIVVVSPLDRIGNSSSSVIDPALEAHRNGPLGNLARWTGGEILVPVAATDVSDTTRQIVSELRQQYLIAFEPSRLPGWHPLELRTRNTNHVVRARSGYVVPNRPADYR